MGWFVIGILVGWFAEWVFFNFFVKGKSESTDTSNSNTSALQEELSSKNNEIRALEAKLAEKDKAGAPSDTGSGSSTTASQSVSNKKPAAKTVAKETTKTTATSKPATKKAVAKKAVTKTAKPKAAAKKATPKKAVVKKPSAKAKKTGDDFTRLSGIGPSMASTLNDLGIDTFKKLAAMDDDILRDMLEASGARLNNNKDVMATWNEQAILADKGDIAGLKKLQDSLKG